MPDLTSLTLPKFSELWQSTLDWSPSQLQQTQFQQLLTQICELNQKVNLTRITSPEAFWEKHLWDSLWGVRPWLSDREKHNVMPESSRDPSLEVIDIGSGGGFPGCPIAIAFPSWQVTLLDSTHKKISCLKTLCQTLPLANVTALCDRAETLGRDARYRETFDLAAIRAVGSSSTCAEYALPFLKVGGMAVLYRGQWSAEEEQILQETLSILGAELSCLSTTTTPLTQGQRHCLYLRKIKVTSPSYPRSNGLPSKYPLGTANSVG
jgi:16S rRNA (guanine527-N7)-methyltransferase